MKKEFGKWLMDIAKYMTTALVLSSVFGEMDSPLVMGIVISGATLTLIIGLLLVKENKKGYICYAKKKKNGTIVATCKKVKQSK